MARLDKRLTVALQILQIPMSLRLRPSRLSMAWTTGDHRKLGKITRI